MNRRILVVDDNPAIHEDFQKILGSAGEEGLADLDQLELELLELSDPREGQQLYSMDFALSGRQALDMLMEALSQGQPYAMAFVDMRMPPGWDGLETIEHLWEQDPGLAVVICTAFSDYSWDELTQRVKNAENLFLLSKPFDMMEIRQAAAAMTLKRHLHETTSAQIEALEENLDQSREELREANLRTRSILDAAPVGILTANEDLCIQELNQLALHLFGCQAEEVIGKPLADLVLLPHTHPGSYLGSGQRIDQSRFPAQIELKRLELESGVVHICIVVDLSQSQRLEAQRQHVDTRVFQSHKRDMAGATAQHFNTFLQAIQTEVEGALAEDPAGVTERLQKIAYQVRKALGDNQRILTYAGQFECVRESLMLPELVSTTLDTMLIPDQVAVRNRVTGQLPPVNGDPKLLGQVLIHLVNNALEAIGSNTGSITLTCGLQALDADFLATRCSFQAPPGSYAWIACSDTGVGIPSANRDRLFDPFYSTQGAGRGLGLAYVLGVLSSHGGTVQVESEVGRGSTLRVYLPVNFLPH